MANAQKCAALLLQLLSCPLTGMHCVAMLKNGTSPLTSLLELHTATNSKLYLKGASEAHHEPFEINEVVQWTPISWPLHVV